MLNGIMSKATTATPAAFGVGSSKGQGVQGNNGQYFTEPKPDTTVSPIQTGQTETHYDEPSSRPNIKLGVGKTRPDTMSRV